MEEPTTADRIFAALGGFGAGVNGRGAQYLKAQSDRQQTLMEMEEKRRNALLTDMRKTRLDLEAGRYGPASQRMQNRLGDLKSLNADDVSHTTAVNQAIQEGRYDEAINDIKTLEEYAIAEGALEPLAQADATKTVSQGVMVKDTNGNMFFANPITDRVTGQQTATMTPLIPGTEFSGKVSGIVQNTTGLTAPEGVTNAADKAAAVTGATLSVEGEMKPNIEAQIETARSEAKAEVERNTQQRLNNIGFSIYDTAVANLRESLGVAKTAPFMAMIPALTANQQAVDKAKALLTPSIKMAFRAKGEGAQSDRDAADFLAMIPDRGTHPEVAAKQLEVLDKMMRAKFGVSLDGEKEPEATQIPEAGPPKSAPGRIVVDY